MSRPHLWLTLLAFVLALGAHAHHADAQAFKPRSKTGLPKRPLVAATTTAATPTAATTPAAAAARTPARAAVTTPAPRKAPARPVAGKRSPAKKKGKDDDDVIVVDDEEEDDE